MPTARTTLRRLVVTLALSAAVVSAHDWEDDNHSYDQARRALERGDALPITEVMKKLHDYVDGDIIATEYEFEFDRWVYEFKVVDRQGHLRVVHVDAATGKLVEQAP